MYSCYRLKLTITNNFPVTLNVFAAKVCLLK